MIDRLVHHAEILALKGDSCRLRDRDLARPHETTELSPAQIWSRRLRQLAHPHEGGQFSTGAKGSISTGLDTDACAA